MTSKKILVLFSIAVMAFFLFSFTKRTEKKAPLSPIGMVVLEGSYLIACQSAKMVVSVDKENGEVINSVGFDLPLTGITNHGEKIYVTSSWSASKVHELNIDLEPLREAEAGFGSCSPIVSPDGNTLYVANQFTNDITFFDTKSLKKIAVVKAGRQPRGIDISPDGKWLFAANLLPSTRADRDTVASDVSIIDTENQKLVKSIALANGSNALRGIKISPDGMYAFISHNLGRFQFPTTQLEKGWMNTSALSIINVNKKEYVATVLLDEPMRGAAGSWGIDCDHENIYVAHSGTHDFSVIGYKELMDKVNETTDKKTLSYNLTFLSDIRQRIKVSGNGPRAIKQSGQELIVASYFSDQLSIYDKSEWNKTTAREISLNPALFEDSVRIGERVFHDAQYCFQSWQACTGCHPDNARVDGLNWDLLNDGIGNPKNCKSMILSHLTPPSMITGIRESAELAVRAGFRHIQLTQIDEGNARAVDLYLSSLQPVPSPFLIKGKLSPKAKKGEQLFKSLACVNCHPGPYYTDLNKHRIGTPGEYDQNDTWDTPTLIECWRTGPWLHDGRSATMRDVYINEKHGIDVDLSDVEIDQLTEYVLSL